MRDMSVINHGSVKVCLEGSDWLIDSSLLSNLPLPLNESIFVSSDPVFAVEVEPVDSTHLIWAHLPPNPRGLPSWSTFTWLASHDPKSIESLRVMTVALCGR